MMAEEEVAKEEGAEEAARLNVGSGRRRMMDEVALAAGSVVMVMVMVKVVEGPRGGRTSPENQDDEGGNAQDEAVAEVQKILPPVESCMPDP